MAAIPPYTDITSTDAVFIEVGYTSSTDVYLTVTAVEIPPQVYEPKPVFERQMKWPRPKELCLAKRFFRPRTAMSRAQTRRQKRKGYLHGC